MSISGIGNLANQGTPNADLLGKLQSQLETNVASAAQRAKQDTLFLTEKAKDLIAQQSGTIFHEEQNETQTARAKESFAD